MNKTFKEIQEIRRKAVNQYIDVYGEYPVLGIFTCDHCKKIYECPYSYDLYNINDECLASK